MEGENLQLMEKTKMDEENRKWKEKTENGTGYGNRKGKGKKKRKGRQGDRQGKAQNRLHPRTGRAKHKAPNTCRKECKAHAPEERKGKEQKSITTKLVEDTRARDD